MTMFNSQLYPTVEAAIAHLVYDFQANPERFWNERDIHWSLFYYLKQESVCGEAYPTELIRAESPTLKVFPGEKPARGHYDLVILNAESYFQPEVQNMKVQAPWQEYLELVQIDVAIEVKLWLSKVRKNMESRVNWDIEKLTEKPHNIENAYFLNFVQLDFKSDYMSEYYHILRDYLIKQKKEKPQLNILCIPSDTKLQPVLNDYWL